MKKVLIFRMGLFRKAERRKTNSYLRRGWQKGTLYRCFCLIFTTSAL